LANETAIIFRAVEEGYLDEICDYAGIEAAKPSGVILPPGVSLIPEPGFESLTEGEGLDFKIKEDLVEKAETNFQPIWFIDANGARMNRAKFKETYGKDPLWMLAYMRRHKGVVPIPNTMSPGSIEIVAPVPHERGGSGIEPVKLGKI